MRGALVAVTMAGLISSACATGAQQPAALPSADADARAAIEAVMAEVLGRPVRLKPGDFVGRDRAEVEYRARGDRSMPEDIAVDSFQLVRTSQECALIHEQTGTYYSLAGLRCDPL